MSTSKVFDLRKFLSFAPSDRFLLVKATFLLGGVRLGLKLLPFRIWRPILARMTQPISEREGTQQVSIYKIVWAITMASQHIPGAKCLDRALATRVLLTQQGYSTQLRIGVTKGKEGQLQAHAWVESKGRTVIGGLGNMKRYYTVMPITGVETISSMEWADK